MRLIDGRSCCACSCPCRMSPCSPRNWVRRPGGRPTGCIRRSVHNHFHRWQLTARVHCYDHPETCCRLNHMASRGTQLPALLPTHSVCRRQTATHGRPTAESHHGNKRRITTDPSSLPAESADGAPDQRGRQLGNVQGLAARLQSPQAAKPRSMSCPQPSEPCDAYGWLCDVRHRRLLPSVRRFTSYDLSLKSPEPLDWQQLRLCYALWQQQHVPAPLRCCCRSRRSTPVATVIT